MLIGTRYTYLITCIVKLYTILEENDKFIVHIKIADPDLAQYDRDPMIWIHSLPFFRHLHFLNDRNC